MNELPKGMKRTTLCEECGQRVSARCAELGLKTVVTDEKLLYNPVDVAINMVVARCLEGIGIAMIMEGFGDELPDPHKGCPIHFLESQVTEDRACPCDDPECPSREPGSIKPFFNWLDSEEDGAPNAVRQYMNERKML